MPNSRFSAENGAPADARFLWRNLDAALAELQHDPPALTSLIAALARGVEAIKQLDRHLLSSEGSLSQVNLSGQKEPLSLPEGSIKEFT